MRHSHLLWSILHLIRRWLLTIKVTRIVVWHCYIFNGVCCRWGFPNEALTSSHKILDQPWVRFCACLLVACCHLKCTYCVICWYIRRQKNRGSTTHPLTCMENSRYPTKWITQSMKTGNDSYREKFKVQSMIRKTFSYI